MRLERECNIVEVFSNPVEFALSDSYLLVTAMAAMIAYGDIAHRFQRTLGKGHRDIDMHVDYGYCSPAKTSEHFKKGDDYDDIGIL